MKALQIAKQRGYRGFQNDIIASKHFGNRSETLQANIYDVLEYAQDMACLLYTSDAADEW